MKSLAMGVASLFALAGAAQAQVVNIDATNGAGNAVSITDSFCPSCFWVGNELNLGPGTYSVTAVDSSFTGALYTAANRFASTNVPNQGWEWSVWLKIGAGALTKYGFGGGIPTNSPGYQVSAAAAFAAAPSPFTFNVTGASTPVKFLWVDDNFGDNAVGSGISVNVTAVPEPATYGMVLAGLGVIGFMLRSRRTRG